MGLGGLAWWLSSTIRCSLPASLFLWELPQWSQHAHLLLQHPQSSDTALEHQYIPIGCIYRNDDTLPGFVRVTSS